MMILFVLFTQLSRLHHFSLRQNLCDWKVPHEVFWLISFNDCFNKYEYLRSVYNIQVLYIMKQMWLQRLEGNFSERFSK